MAMLHLINGEIRHVTTFKDKQPITEDFKLEDGTTIVIKFSPDGSKVSIYKRLSNGELELIAK